MKTSFQAAHALGRVTVMGSLNVDRLWRVQRLPGAGETVFATEARLEFGGKGANQAVAAARHGSRVAMVGALGDDADGRMYREHLRSEGVSAEWVAMLPGVATGAAFICVDRKGENQIIVDPGANGKLSTGYVSEALAVLLPQTDVLVVGLECPLQVALTALRAAAAAGVCAVFNPSPVLPEFPWGSVPIEVVIVNEHECAAVFAQPEPQEAARCAVRNLIVTQGSSPTVWVGAEGVLPVPAYPVQPLDTVGAGDTFAGTLAARRAEGAPWTDAIRIANIAAALSTLGVGAQAPIPRRAEVEIAAVERR